jgi:hypothetical protein
MKEEQRKMFAAERALARQSLISNGFASPTGVPLYDTVARVMNDRMISVGQTPAPDATPAPAPAATPAATPAAARPNAPAASTVVKVTTPTGVMDFPNQAAADAYKKKAGIK